MSKEIPLRKRTPEELDEKMMEIAIENVLLKKKIAEVNKILAEVPNIYACDKEVYNWQEAREAIEKLRKCLAEETTKQ